MGLVWSCGEGRLDEVLEELSGIRDLCCCVVGMEDSFRKGVCVVYTKEERVLKKCNCVLCVILKNGNMVKELIVVLCACIRLGGVKNSLV
jgi:hypothetical protein